MCKKLVSVLFLISIMVISTTVQAEVFTDNFDIPRDFLTEGIEGTGWDGFIGLGDNETVNALNASIDREGSLYIESENSWWEGSFSPMGPFLYKIVQGDFIATVQATDFAGEIGTQVTHCDSFIMARVPDLDDAGPGEDFECMHYFPTWVGNMGRNYDNNSESEWGSTGDGYNNGGEGATYIQLERVGNTFYFRRSFDGQTWTELSGSPVTREDLDGLSLQVGIGHSMYSTEVGYVAFDNFHLEGPGVLSAGKASLPNPTDKADDVSLEATLSWKRGISAVTHNVYFGVDANDVGEASVDDPREVLVSQNQGESTYEPGLLDYDQTYYWRIDEVNEAEPESPWKGEVWSFTTANFIIIDDFEDYNDFPPNEIWNTWIDGFGDPTNGSTAGYPDPDFNAGEHYVETLIRHEGKQSMPFFYDNAPGLSEATRTLTELNDWTVDDVIALTLFYYGDAGNAIEPMYVALNGNAVVNNDDPRAVLATDWTRWDILLQEFADLGSNLSSVNSISVGIGNKANPAAGGAGRVFFDDIRLYRSIPQDTEPEPESVDPGTDNLIAYYNFENNVQDGSGNGNNAAISGNPQYVTGATGYGMSLEFDGIGDYVTLPIGSAIGSMTNATIAMWVNFSGVGVGGGWQRIFDFGSGETVYMFLTPSVGTTGPMRFAIRNDANPESMVTAPNRLPTGWHHVAVTIDGTSMELILYLDGKNVVSASTITLPADMGQTTQNWLGRSQFAADAYYEGALDECRIYNKVLSLPEVLYLVGK